MDFITKLLVLGAFFLTLPLSAFIGLCAFWVKVFFPQTRSSIWWSDDTYYPKKKKDEG